MPRIALIVDKDIGFTASCNSAVRHVTGEFGKMAIYHLFKTMALEPAEIAILAAAYEDALRILRLTDREDPITEVVAKKIIDVAELGERDPARICEAALKELGVTQEPS